MTTFRFLFLHSNPSAVLPQFPSYAFAESMQTVLQQEFLAWKARLPDARGPPPPPGIICFTPTPTYTLGRRQTQPLSHSEVASLRSPLFLSAPGASARWPGSSLNSNSNGIRDTLPADSKRKTAYFLPTIANAPRGGLTTYHGPGQLVIWPVIDLHSPLHAHFSVRDYACLLEQTTIAALDRQYGLKGFTTDNPGVWIRSENEPGPAEVSERKIAALGVHLRRHVTSLGVAINYSTPVTGPPETNPWGRIVACGIGDRRVTSVRAELGSSAAAAAAAAAEEAEAGDPDPDHTNQELGKLAATWRAEFFERLKLHEGAESMLKGYDTIQSIRDLGAHIKGRDDFLVKASPISNLET
ncbi:hypothetical protein GGR50DRAFT_633204 [Xylaria sp. CBS 124048]|nr:hypothetical protein GGR50DRAFT_633204 [Xylaria sp. CBS 124048]